MHVLGHTERVTQCKWSSPSQRSPSSQGELPGGQLHSGAIPQDRNLGHGLLVGSVHKAHLS